MFEEVSAKAAATALSRKQNVVVKDQRDQANARSAILRLYPRIALPDVDIILGHGFAKGTGRVGRTGTLSMDEKVMMAVTAHVRHTHTSYDSILLGQDRRKGTKDGRRKEARAEIRHEQDAVLNSWRGPKAASHPKQTRALSLAQALKMVNPKASHRAINTPTPTMATETRKRHRTMNVTQETLPLSKRPKRQAAVEAGAVISHGQGRVSRESSEGLSEEYVDLLSDDAGDDNDDDDNTNDEDENDDLSQRSISVTLNSSLISTSVKSKGANLPSPISRVKTRKTMEQSQRYTSRTKTHRRGLEQQMEAAEDSSARTTSLDTAPDGIMIEVYHGDELLRRREWEEIAEDDDDCIVLLERPVLKPPGRIRGAGPGAARHRPWKYSNSGRRN